MSEEGVEMWFRTEVEDLRVMGVIEMSEYAEELTVDVFDC